MPELVCYALPNSAEHFAMLREMLDDSMTIVSGEPTLQTTILIEGRPSEERIHELKHLRAVVVPFAGIPPQTLSLLRTNRHIALHNLHHNAPETAEVAMALLFAVAKRVPQMDSRMREHDWSPRYAEESTLRLAGRKALILGCGEIGKRIAKSCESISMNVLQMGRTSRDGVLGIDHLHHALPQSDVIILALPYTSETDGLIGNPEFALMKPEAILVNISRGGIIDEEALFKALNAQRIFGAGLDVWYRYPESAEQSVNCQPSRFPFHKLENCVMSPHRGGTSREVEDARISALAELLNSFKNGETMRNRVDLELGY